MKNFTKILLTITLSLFSFVNTVAKDYEKIQILVDPAASWFVFRINDGTITPNPIAPRVAGATFISNGLIYPGGTIDTKNQTSFLVDKHGNPLTPANSLGMFWEESAVLTDYALLAPPANGTAVTLSLYAFNFNNVHDKTSVFGTGFLNSTGIAQGRNAAYKGTFAETGGTDDNQGADHEFKVKFIPAPDFTTLVIEVKFKKQIDA